jgi:hypothetical protein
VLPVGADEVERELVGAAGEIRELLALRGSSETPHTPADSPDVALMWDCPHVAQTRAIRVGDFQRPTADERDLPVMRGDPRACRRRTVMGSQRCQRDRRDNDDDDHSGQHRNCSA